MRSTTLMYVLLGIIVLGVIAIVGFFLFYDDNNPGDLYNDNNTENTDSSLLENQNTTNSIRNLVQTNDDIKCSWTDTTVGGEVFNGTTYINNGNFYQAVASYNNPVSYMLYDKEEGMLYIWTSGENSGVKYKVEDFGTYSENSADSSVDYDNNISMDCSNWEADQNLLKPPGDIEFENISVINENIQQ